MKIVFEMLIEFDLTDPEEKAFVRVTKREDLKHPSKKLNKRIKSLMSQNDDVGL